MPSRPLSLVVALPPTAHQILMMKLRKHKHCTEHKHLNITQDYCAKPIKHKKLTIFRYIMMHFDSASGVDVYLFS